MQSRAIEKIAVGALLGGYEAVRFKNKPTISPLTAVEILAQTADGDAAAAISRGQAFARGAILARCTPLSCPYAPSVC
jgi:uncharacterized membrane protein YgaE (UPF0421/DUF939 family)